MVGNRTENFPKTVRSGTLSCADYPDSRAWRRRALSSPQTAEHPLPARILQWHLRYSPLMHHMEPGYH